MVDSGVDMEAVGAMVVGMATQIGDLVFALRRHFLHEVDLDQNQLDVDMDLAFHRMAWAFGVAIKAAAESGVDVRPVGLDVDLSIRERKSRPAAVSATVTLDDLRSGAELTGGQVAQLIQVHQMLTLMQPDNQNIHLIDEAICKHFGMVDPQP